MSPAPSSPSAPPDDARLDGATAPRRPTAGARLKQLAPWLVATVALLWVFRSVRWADLAAALHAVPLGRFLVASVILLFANCAADSAAMYFTFGWFGCRVPYRELFVVRAATYLLAVVQYYVGQAAILGYLHQRKGAPFWRGAGWILFISGINMGVLVLLASAGMARADIQIKWLRTVPVVVGAGALLYAALLWLQPKKIASIALLAPMFEMGIVGHVKATIVRLPHIFVLLLWHYLALRWFGVKVPPLVALVYLPAVFFFAALPVSVQGLGLAQWAAVTFFAGYAERGAPAVLAYSLAMTGVSLVIQVSMGFGFLRVAQRLGLMGRRAEAEAPAEAPPATAARLGAANGAGR